MEDQISQVAVLIGDPVRAKILWALLDGRAYTATELSVYTDTSAQNLSMHLGKLVDGELLAVEKQGRHRYYSFARPEIATGIEGLANLMPAGSKRPQKKEKLEPVEYCRTCYDHLAGQIGVLVTEAMVRENFLIRSGDDFIVTGEGETWFAQLGLSVESIKSNKRSFARACLDWSERRYHLAGSLGAAWLQFMLENDWIRRKAGTRAMVITRKGSEGLHACLGVEA